MKVSELPYPESDIVWGHSHDTKRYLPQARELLEKLGVSWYKYDEGCDCGACWEARNEEMGKLGLVLSAFREEARYYRELLKKAGIDIYE